MNPTGKNQHSDSARIREVWRREPAPGGGWWTRHYLQLDVRVNGRKRTRARSLAKHATEEARRQLEAIEARWLEERAVLAVGHETNTCGQAAKEEV